MVRLTPRIITAEMQIIPGDWLTPPLKAGTAVRRDQVRAYVNDLIVSRAHAVSLDSGEVIAEIPDTPICLVPPDQYNPAGTWLPQTKLVTLVGQVEIRLDDPRRVRDELQALPRQWGGLA